MCPSSESRIRRATQLAGAAVLFLLAVVSAAPAWAAPDSEAPVVDITARVVDIVFASADPERRMRMDQAPGSVRVTLDATVLFGKDSATIRSSSAARLGEIVAELRRRGPGRVRVAGYTDDLVSVAHGLDLSRRRARAVASVLRDDLPETSYPFSVVGRGEADPVVPNTSEANRRINRRVVVTYTAR